MVYIISLHSSYFVALNSKKGSLTKYLSDILYTNGILKASAIICKNLTDRIYIANETHLHLCSNLVSADTACAY